jgi:hypothetical protein
VPGAAVTNGRACGSIHRAATAQRAITTSSAATDLTATRHMPPTSATLCPFGDAVDGPTRPCDLDVALEIGGVYLPD